MIIFFLAASYYFALGLSSEFKGVRLSFGFFITLPLYSILLAV